MLANTLDQALHVLVTTVQSLTLDSLTRPFLFSRLRHAILRPVTGYQKPSRVAKLLS